MDKLKFIDTELDKLKFRHEIYTNRFFTYIVASSALLMFMFTQGWDVGFFSILLLTLSFLFIGWLSGCDAIVLRGKNR